MAKPKSFASRAQFRAWLEGHHDSAGELLLRCFKVHARERGVTYNDALEEALCFGWIDGVRRAFDADSFVQRFSPRRPHSKWSQINRRRMRELQAKGLLAPAGLAVWQAASQAPTGYSFESRPVALTGPYLEELEANRKAFAYLQQEAPWYRRITSFWVMSAKQDETRRRRLAKLIACSAAGRRIEPLDRKPPRKNAKKKT